MAELFNVQPLGGKLIFIGLAFAVLAVIFVVITNILNKQEKPSTKVWRVLFIVSAIIFALCLASGLLLLQFSDDGGNALSQEQPEDLTDIERFAENNDITIELAESLESALSSVSYGRRREYSLNLMYNFEQQDDWSDGQRYKVWADMEYIWYIYAKDDTVVSIRDSNMDFIYDAEIE